MRIPMLREVSIEEIKADIEKAHPELVCKIRLQKTLIVHEPGSSAAAQITKWRKTMVVNEGFSTLGGQMLFVFILIVFGIVLPGLFYLIFFFPKQKKIRNKIGDFVKQNYGQGSEVK